MSQTATKDVLAPASEQFVRLVPAEYARRHLVLSEGQVVHDGVTHECLAVAERTLPHVVHNIGCLLQRPTRTRIVPIEHLAVAIDHTYHGLSNESTSLINSEPMVDRDVLESQLQETLTAAEQDILSTDGKAAVVRLVDLMLFEALNHKASDVHIHPTRDCVLIRVRVDGSLRTLRRLPASLAPSLTSRVKVMASLDVVERRIPQDGRASITLGMQREAAYRRIELRVSTLPSTFGERVVLRLLDPNRSSQTASFSSLGMPVEISARYSERVNRASGIVLSTGPTGSGKTTTLYATLSWLSRHHFRSVSEGCELNMMTIEDPVEYDLSHGADVPLAISQTQVDVRKGMTFASGLRHILRQDPDVIMVGEIRDEETARIAVQASLTGHIVLSTLHTNDAPSAIARLLDLSVEPFLLSTALSAVLAQRLVRLRHAECSGSGCATCLHAGFSGRTGIFELLLVDDAMRALINKGASTDELRHHAISHGMITLRRAGEELVRSGATTLAEVHRVVDAEEEMM